jgi:hypothetical protein
MMYAPVCGASGKTFGNACAARCEGVKVAYEGECNKVNPPPAGAAAGNASAPGRGADARGPGGCACPRDFRPVCGKDGKSHPNSCMAKCAGTEVAHEGECEAAGAQGRGAGGAEMQASAGCARRAPPAATQPLPSPWPVRRLERRGRRRRRRPGAAGAPRRGDAALAPALHLVTHFRVNLRRVTTGRVAPAARRGPGL